MQIIEYTSTLYCGHILPDSFLGILSYNSVHVSGTKSPLEGLCHRPEIHPHVASQQRRSEGFSM